MGLLSCVNKAVIDEWKPLFRAQRLFNKVRNISDVYWVTHVMQVTFWQQMTLVYNEDFGIEMDS